LPVTRKARIGREALVKPKTILTVSLALALTLPGAAAASGKGALGEKTQGSGTVQALETDSRTEDALLVPLRYVAESLGAAVKWNDEERSVTVSKAGLDVVIRIGQESATVNGQTVSTGRKVEIVDGLTVVPLTFVEDSFGISLSWDGHAVVADDKDFETKAALAFYHLLQGNTEGWSGISSEALKKSSAAERIASLTGQIKPLLGDSAKQLSNRTVENGVHTNVIMQYESKVLPAPLEVTLRFNKQGELDDLLFNVAAASSGYKTAAYDKPELYTEQETVIGEGVFALPGTLSIPKGEGPFPAVILVHGSGANDRDETISGSKPFKDLAGGLASQGIAVLRYEKVTREHALKAAGIGKFSLWDETVADVGRALEILKQTEGIDAERLFIVGHSQGGYAMPLVIKEDTAAAIKGAVLVAGPSGNISDVLVNQQFDVLERLKETGQAQELINQQEMAAAAYKGIRDLIHSPSYSVDNLPKDFPLGDPYWWYEQRDYQPAELARSQHTPMLILQGENDWQVSMEQFDGWKEALKDRTDVEYKSYPKVNHLLSEYDGVSTGLEYTQPANVSPQIIEDTAAWIKKQ
jgi:uncharacterized protein